MSRTEATIIDVCFVELVAALAVAELSYSCHCCRCWFLYVDEANAVMVRCELFALLLQQQHHHQPRHQFFDEEKPCDGEGGQQRPVVTERRHTAACFQLPESHPQHAFIYIYVIMCMYICIYIYVYIYIYMYYYYSD